MLQRQISVFLENKRGRLSEVTRALGDGGVNLDALSIADTSDFGVLRMIVDQTDKALEILRESGFAVSETQVLALSADDRPGGLAAVMRSLDKLGIDIEYMYAYFKRDENLATVIARVEKPAEAEEKLRQAANGSRQ